MNHFRLLLACSLSLSVHSTLAGNPIPEGFTTIAARNVFRLSPPVPLAIIIPPPNRPKVSLQGITTILGRALALVTVEPSSKSAEFPQTSYVLAQGDSRFDVLVLEIDVDSGAVRLNNLGAEQILVLQH